MCLANGRAVGGGKQLSRVPATSSSEDKSSGWCDTAQAAGGNEPSGSHGPSRDGEDQRTHLHTGMNEQEKEGTLQEFVAWQKARRLSAETSRQR